MSVEEMTEFEREVIEALEKHGVSRVDHIGETPTQRCARDNVPLWRFVGLKDGWQHMAHVCPVCRKGSVWNLDVSRPAEHFEF